MLRLLIEAVEAGVKMRATPIVDDDVPSARDDFDRKARIALNAVEATPRPAGLGLAKTAMWTELHEAFKKDGFLLPPKAGDHVRAWIECEVKRAFNDSGNASLSHHCRKCGHRYQPKANESEDCPHCGFDGVVK